MESTTHWAQTVYCHYCHSQKTSDYHDLHDCAELEEQKEAKAQREGSPWGERLDPHSDYTAASPISDANEQQEMDMEQGPSPDEGATGYYETGQDSAFQFEPPRAPAHYGASRNSPGPSEDPYPVGFHDPWGAAAGGTPHTMSCCTSDCERLASSVGMRPCDHSSCK